MIQELTGFAIQPKNTDKTEVSLQLVKQVEVLELKDISMPKLDLQEELIIKEEIWLN